MIFSNAFCWAEIIRDSYQTHIWRESRGTDVPRIDLEISARRCLFVPEGQQGEALPDDIIRRAQMSGLTLWMNREIERLKEEMDLLFDRMIRDFGTEHLAKAFDLTPRITVSEKKDKLIVRAEVPHLRLEDLEVSIIDDVLCISGRRSEERTGQGAEVRHTGSVKSEFRLPCKVKVEKANATYQNGVLEIILPKCPPKARRLSITAK
jgi:HSP20 family protein